jgi:hypothetical protein
MYTQSYINFVDKFHELQEVFNFLIDIIFIDISFVGFQQVTGIPMGTCCAPLVADLFLLSFKFSFMQH